MDDMITFVNNLASTPIYNESLSSMLRQQLKDNIKKPFAGDYYNLTDLCNPVKIYYDRTNPPVEKSPELQKKLEWGNKLHEITQAWLSTFDDFVITEGTVDGFWVGIPRVRGRIDCRIGESIFEIKTKESLPENIEELFSKYPHDVEQISFYSVIHPSHDKINYLLFIKDSHPFEMKVFKVEIKDLNKLRALLENRINILDEAIKTKNPLKLGRCRYYKNDCQFEKSGSCNCDKFSPLSTEILEKSIVISIDEKMTKKLEELRKKFHSSKIFFTTRDIISPRKYGLVEDWNSEKEKSESQNYLNSLIKKLPASLSLDERKKIIESTQESRLRIPPRWINVRSATNDESIPYIVKANMSPSIQTFPHEYSKAELGLIVSNYKKTRGLIFIIYPKKDNFIQVFEITYKKTNEILNKTKEIIDKLEKKEKNILELPPCPDFMNNKVTCPLIRKCNSEEGKGCIKKS